MKYAERKYYEKEPVYGIYQRTYIVAHVYDQKGQKKYVNKPKIDVLGITKSYDKAIGIIDEYMRCNMVDLSNKLISSPIKSGSNFGDCLTDYISVTEPISKINESEYTVEFQIIKKDELIGTMSEKRFMKYQEKHDIVIYAGRMG